MKRTVYAVKADFRSMIITYGLTKEENGLLKKIHADFAFYDASPCFSDLLALNSVAMIINPKILRNKRRLVEGLVEVYDSCVFNPLFIFTSSPAALRLPEFMNNVCEVSDEQKMTELFGLAKNYLLCYEDAKDWLDAKADFVLDDDRRVDDAPIKRVELRCNTIMGSRSVASATDLVNRAAQWNHGAIAITDYGVVQSFPEAFQAARDKGIKIIYGVRVNLFAEDSQNAYCHATLLAKNMSGLKNLYKIISLFHINSPHPHHKIVPLISNRVLAEHREGLLIGASCYSNATANFEKMLRDAQTGQPPEKACVYDYLEITPYTFFNSQNDDGARDFKLLPAVNKKIAMLGEKLNLPVVAVGDVRFLNPEDRKALSVLTEDAPQPPRYFRTTEEMLAEFEYLGKEKAYEAVVANTNLIAGMIEDIEPVPEGRFLPKIDGADKDIAAICNARAKEIYGADLPRSARERLDAELDSITKNGYSSIYMIARKLAKKSNDDGYIVGSRGGVGASLIAYLLGITEIDPLKYNIPFESFAGLGMDKLPDIELNFDGHYQAKIHRHLEEMLGKDRVAMAGTIWTLSERTARERVGGYFDRKGIVPYPWAVSSLAEAIAGVKRTTGLHPGGLLIIPSDKEIYDFTPLQHSEDLPFKPFVTHFDYVALHKTLYQFDLLENDSLTIIGKLVGSIGIDAKDIPLNDEKTLAMLISANTLGVPEFGTKAVRNMIRIAKPETFDDLVKISGLSRNDVWQESAEPLIKSGTAAISEVIALKDEIMVYLIGKGVCRESAYEIMENVHMGRGLTDGQADLMAKAGAPSWYIDSCNKIGYLFPKAHAVAYTLMAFRIAWFKAHYPDAFYKAYFEVKRFGRGVDLLALDIAETKNRIKEIKAGCDAATYEEEGTREGYMHMMLKVRLEMLQRQRNTVCSKNEKDGMRYEN